MALLLAELSRRSTSPLSRTHCAETLGYGSRTAFQKRLDRLTRSFAGIWCHQVDNLGRRIAGSLSKYYLVDPLLAWLPATIRSGIDEPDMTCLTENAIAPAIARAVDAHAATKTVVDIGHPAWAMPAPLVALLLS